MARPPRSSGAETRQRIIEVAKELFGSQGFDKTSLRDIAERLGITKAALYYYFARKEEILLEIHLELHERGTAIFDQIEAIPDGPERVAAWPQLIRRFVAEIAGDRDLMVLHQRNAGAIEALHSDERNRLENDEFDERMERIFSSPAIPLETRLRMAATVGVLTETLVDSGAAFAADDPDEVIALILKICDEMLGVGPPAPASA